MLVGGTGGGGGGRAAAGREVAEREVRWEALTGNSGGVGRGDGGRGDASKHALRHCAPLLGAHHPGMCVCRRCGPPNQLALRREQPPCHVPLARSI